MSTVTQPQLGYNLLHNYFLALLLLLFEWKSRESVSDEDKMAAKSDFAAADTASKAEAAEAAGGLSDWRNMEREADQNEQTS